MRAAFGGRPEAEFHEHPGANHAFDNHNAALFHHPEASARAWEQTRAFLREKLPV
ncbi:MAG TPA: dienelactone hydrolase family protein [Actinomycetota bacterium]|nr:dienelactone hydrolase family protein [Actinomycetota bacterium]